MTQLKSRLLRNAKVQEGEVAYEDVSEILKELNHTLNEYESLVKRINRTNSEIQFDENNTIADILAYRDKITIKRNMLSNLVEEAVVKVDRYTRHEVKFVATIDVNSIQKQVDQLSKLYRELDTKIQGLNWTTELLD
jgi:uncharacterized protein YqfB (UPF0267 family)